MTPSAGRTDVTVVRGQPFQLRLRYINGGTAQSFSVDTPLYGNAVNRVNRSLVLDFSDYLALDPNDSTAVLLSIPPDVTADLAGSAEYDVWAGYTPLIWGHFFVAPTVSAGPPSSS